MESFAKHTVRKFGSDDQFLRSRPPLTFNTCSPCHAPSSIQKKRRYHEWDVDAIDDPRNRGLLKKPTFRSFRYSRDSLMPRCHID